MFHWSGLCRSLTESRAQLTRAAEPLLCGENVQLPTTKSTYLSWKFFFHCLSRLLSRRLKLTIARCFCSLFFSFSLTLRSPHGYAATMRHKSESEKKITAEISRRSMSLELKIEEESERETAKFPIKVSQRVSDESTLSSYNVAMHVIMLLKRSRAFLAARRVCNFMLKKKTPKKTVAAADKTELIDFLFIFSWALMSTCSECEICCESTLLGFITMLMDS